MGCGKDEVGFGASSTQNSFNFSVNIGRTLEVGDELIITEMDHRCNSQPWRRLGLLGFEVKTVKLDLVTQQLDFEDYKSKLSAKTKVVAINWGSNAIGTVTDVKKFVEAAHEVGALTIIDAVHYAAHFPVDVKEINADVLLCSAYKWFGSHIGLIYMKKELLDNLEFNNAGADDIAEGGRKFHMGTPAYEHMAGVTATVNFIAEIGAEYVDYFKEELGNLKGRRRKIVAGMMAFDAYETPLSVRLRKSMRALPGITVYGPAEGDDRTPTVAFTVDGYTPEFVAKILGDKGINVWHGDFYAIEAVEALGLTERGGLIRAGMAPYCTESDIDRIIATVTSIVNGEYDN